MLGDVSNRLRTIDEAARLGRRLQAELGRELREARLARGLRLQDVARALNMSPSQVSRIELGHLRALSLAGVARHGAAVGLRLRARFYPAGGGLRDAAQLDLLRRFRARTGDAWTWQLEAPLPIPGDLRAFDALLTRGAARVAVEAITRLRDAQAQIGSLRTRNEQLLAKTTSPRHIEATPGLSRQQRRAMERSNRNRKC